MTDARAAEFRQLLEAGDVDALRSAWASSMPHLPQPESREQAEIVMHRARTEAASIPLRPRAYSHRWLTERLLPSGLPDRLRPSAERLYPRFVDAVMVGVTARNPDHRPAAAEVQRAMCDAVEDAYAEGRRDPVFVKARMMEARQKARRQLFG